MKEINKEIKTFTARIPKALWMFLKKRALDTDQSLTDLIILVLEKYKKKSENKLTSLDT